LNKLGHFPTDKPESHASSGSNQPWSLPKIIPLLGVLPMKNDEKCIYIYIVALSVSQGDITLDQYGCS